MTEKDIIIQDLRRENAELRARVPKYPADHIDREALRDALYDADAITMQGVKLLNQFPAADIEPVRHGHWIVKQTALGKIYSICSNCEYDFVVENDGHFSYLDLTGMPRCPNCGAKMDEVSK